MSTAAKMSAAATERVKSVIFSHSIEPVGLVETQHIEAVGR